MHWMRFFLLCSLLLPLPSLPPAQTQPPTQEREIDFDEPEDEERLNRELWEAIKKTPYSMAKEYVAKAQRERSAPTDIVLPNGWKLAPAGTQIEVGRFPYEAIAYAGHIVVLNTGYYTGTAKPEVSIVDTASGQVRHTLNYEALFPSAQVGKDGDLYISGGVSQKVYRVNNRFEKVTEYTVNGYAGALAPIDAKHIAVAYLVAAATPDDFSKGKLQQGRLAILNTVTGTIVRDMQIGYFPYALRFANDKLYAALLGEHKLHIYNTELKLIKALDVGRSPQDILTDGNRLYITNANSDSVSMMDTKREEIIKTFDLRAHRTKFGGAPTSCAIDGDRLYVTLANINAIAVLDKRSGRRLGYIPTGWYPTKVLFDQNHLLTLSAKGIRPRRPNPKGPQPSETRSGPDYVLTLLKGTLGILPKQDIPIHLKAWTRQVEEGSPLLGTASGMKLPIRYVFYIVRENRTYDQVLGDLPRGNGDRFLTLFGRHITPNGHRIAEEFVTLDNYYADGEISVLGHSFTTSGYASPFLEWLGNVGYSGRWRGYPYGMVPAVTSPTYLWDALDEKRVDYRIYGENYFLYTRGYDLIREAFGADSVMAKKFYAQMMSLASQTDRGRTFYNFARPFYGQAHTLKDALSLLDKPEFAEGLSQFLCGDKSLAAAFKEQPNLKRKFAEYLTRYPFNYRSWDLSISDLERVQAWKTDFEQQLKRKRVARLQYLWLPNDHTAGASKIPLPPEQLVAQNDAALGRIIETISHSPIWKESLILVTEDDAQNGPDHVDATRTIALAVGPYVKRNAVVSDRYDQLSMLRTIGLLLGLRPLNRNDALAVPMFGIFTETPDFRPYAQPLLPANLADADRERFHQLGGK